MTTLPSIIWITGAGRCGTHLTGMLADGHPRVNAFPAELPIVADWERLVAEDSGGGRVLPGRLVDGVVASRYLRRREIDRALPCSLEGFLAKGVSEPISLPAYLISMNRRLFGDGERVFLFHSPGCQIGMLAGGGEDDAADRIRILLLLRHPIQNYLAWVEHLLQKGRGYRPSDKVNPEKGLHSILHLALLRVMRAFQAAWLWRDDPRVVVSRLEDFSARPEERLRVWERLGLDAHPSLETLSRGGKAAEAHSGKLRKTTIQPVSTDLYDPLLAMEEVRALDRCKAMFEPFYPDPLGAIRKVREGSSEGLLRQRERACLTHNLEAAEKRKERIASLIRERPKGPVETARWPARLLYILLSDRVFYPDMHLLRYKKAIRSAVKGLEAVPDIARLHADRTFGGAP